MRSSVSEILTEQTLGRGMRLPFGHYTGIEILDTLEVVAHERYEELLKKAGVLNEAFVDYRTRAALKINAQGQQVVSRETTQSTVTPIIATSDTTTPPPRSTDDNSTPVVTTVQERSQQVAAGALKLKASVERRLDAPTIKIPVLRMSVVQSSFTLADITDADAFAKLGASLGADPAGELSRTLLGARSSPGKMVVPGALAGLEVRRCRAATIQTQSSPNIASSMSSRATCCAPWSFPPKVDLHSPGFTAKRSLMPPPPSGKSRSAPKPGGQSRV